MDIVLAPVVIIINYLCIPVVDFRLLSVIAYIACHLCIFILYQVGCYITFYIAFSIHASSFCSAESLLSSFHHLYLSRPCTGR